MVVLVLLFAGVPVALGMAFVGMVGLILLTNMTAMINIVGTVPFNLVTNEIYIVLPLFLLMAEIVFRTGLSTDMYIAINRMMGRLPGGLAAASVGACAVLSAASASSTVCATL